MLREMNQIGRLRYKIFSPVQQTPESQPLLLFLHGSQEHAGLLSLDAALARHGPLRNDEPTQQAHGDRFIILFPQLPGDHAGDVWRDYAAEVGTVVETVRSAYHGDPQRIYLTGFSYGGNGVFDLALAPALAPLWAAVWPVDPTRVPPTPLQQPVWLSLGPRSRRDRARYIDRLTLRSTADNPAAAPLFVVEDRGQDHGLTAASAYGDQQVYDWLLTKRL